MDLISLLKKAFEFLSVYTKVRKGKTYRFVNTKKFKLWQLKLGALH